MERQLKERLIGAAVLVAVAVVMVPEMFSGPHSHSGQAVDASSASSAQVKTYHIDLQPSPAQSAESTPEAAVEPPAEKPRDEVSLPTANTPDSSSAGSVASASSVIPHAATEIEAPIAKATDQSVPAPQKAPDKGAVDAKLPAGDWVVQVGSFAAQDTARQIAGKLKGQGYPVSVSTVTVSGKTLYRVRVGATSKRSAADATLQKLKPSYPGASVVPASR